MIDDDDDLEADVARLREKWFGADAKPIKALDAEEQAVAAKWLGKTEARKLSETRNGKRYRPPVVLGHYGYIPLARSEWWSSGIVGDYWYLEVFRGGEKETVYEGERMGCLKAVARLQRMGISVTRVGQERSPEELAPPVRAKPERSKRFAAMEHLKGFRYGR